MTRRLQVFSIFSILMCFGFAQTTSVIFEVNMNHMISEELFNPDNEFVDLAGSFNNWNGNADRFSDENSDGIYELSKNLIIGEAVEFKARINGAWNGREEFPNGGPNRSYTVAANDTVSFWYNDQLPDTVLQVFITVSGVNNLPGQAVQFFDQSKGNPTSWSWEFPGGNPQISTEQNPIVTYPSEGSYDVSLTITNVQGETVSKTFQSLISVGLRDTYWWNDAVFYEIFVRSFYDHDGDGKGDFNGLIEKLDYLNDGNPATHSDLGVTGIWLMPIQQSPSYHGYDVTDYRTIESDYGTNEDFKKFIEEAHKRGISVIIDYVMNHSSSEHPWFVASKSTSSDQRNWYRWNPTPLNSSGPWGQQVWHNNNGAYYYGLFWGGMPDLNYETPAVKMEMFDISTFWLQEMNVDGFRLDAVKYIYETNSQLEDTEETFQFWKDFRNHYKSINPDAFAVGEAWTSTNKVKKYVENGGLDYCFEFDLASAILNGVSNGNPTVISSQAETVMGAYPYLQFGTFLTNHDIDRVMNQMGQDEAKMKLASQLLLTLPGIPYLYYGEEIGMLGTKPDEDIRRPMQWDNSTNAGFSDGSPWRSPYSDYPQKNVELQQKNPESLLNNYKDFISLRNEHEALRQGNYTTLSSENASTLSFLRNTEEDLVIVVSNLGNINVTESVSLPSGVIEPGEYTLVNLRKGPVGNFEVREGASAITIGEIAPQSTQLLKLLPSGQIEKEVSFMVDMSELIESGVFNPDEDRVYMNDLNSDSFEMRDNDNDHIYLAVLTDVLVGHQIDYNYSVRHPDGGTKVRESPLRRYRVRQYQNILLDKFRLEKITGIDNEHKSNDWIYPNPATDVLYISGPTKPSNFQIFNLNGKLMKKGTFMGGEINLSTLAPGMYLLKFSGQVTRLVIR